MILLLLNNDDNINDNINDSINNIINDEMTMILMIMKWSNNDNEMK